VTDRLPVKTKLGYAVGDFAMNFYWQSMALFLIFFYTDVLGISALWAGITFMIASIWDGISDPIMGIIADRTRTRQGRYRPYLIYGSLPLAASLVLAFLPVPVEGAAAVVWALATHLLLRTFYTVVSIPYSSLSARLTGDANERISLAGYRMQCAALGGLTVAYFGPMLVAFLGQGNPRLGWPLTMGVLAVVSVFLFTLCYLTTAEPEDAPGEPFSVADTMSTVVADSKGFWNLLRTNRPLAQVFGMIIVGSITLTMFSKNLLYYFKYQLENPGAASWGLALPAAVMVLTVPVWGFIAKKTSKRIAWLTGCAWTGAGFLAFFVIDTKDVTVIAVNLAALGAGSAAFAVLFWSMLPDTVEYGEWATGVREEAKVFGFAAFAQKLALGINAGLLGVLLNLAGFTPNQPQTPETLTAMKAIMTLIPVAGLVISAWIAWFYRLDSALHAKLRAEIASRAKG